MERGRRRSEQETVDAMKSRRLSIRTKRNYASRIATLERWIKNHPTEEVRSSYDVATGKLVLPLPQQTVLLFFGSIGNGFAEQEAQEANAEPGDENSDSESVAEELVEAEPLNMKAHSTIGGFRSAIVDLYKSHRILHEFPKEEVAEFVSGYKRTLALVATAIGQTATGHGGATSRCHC